jgi:CopG family nickel-responsive transcriptional regulator
MGLHMGELTRTGVAIDSDLLTRFDRFIEKRGYGNRSEALRDLIRDRLISAVVEDPGALVVGSITLIYDHHSRLLPDKLTNLQHEHHNLVIATTHAWRCWSSAGSRKMFNDWPIC